MLSGRDVNEIVPLVFDFLGVRDPDRAVPSMDPEARKGKLLAFVRHLVQARSARRASSQNSTRPANLRRRRPLDRLGQ